MLHRIDAYQSSGAAKPSFAMNGDSARSWLGKGFLAAGKKFVFDILNRRRTVQEYNVFMFDCFFSKLSTIVLCSVKTDDFCDIELPEDVDIA